MLEEDEALIMDFLFDFIDPECLVAYLSFDNVNMAQNLILDEGPYQNHAHFDGPVSFEHNNYSCENTTIIKDGGEIYFNGSNFQNKPRYLRYTIQEKVFNIKIMCFSVNFSCARGRYFVLLFPRGLVLKFCWAFTF